MYTPRALDAYFTPFRNTLNLATTTPDIETILRRPCPVRRERPRPSAAVARHFSASSGSPRVGYRAVAAECLGDLQREEEARLR